MIEFVLGALAVVGGIAIVLDLGGIASSYARFETSISDAVAARMFAWVRPARSPGSTAQSERRLRRRTWLLRSSGLLFAAIGAYGIALGLGLADYPAPNECRPVDTC